MANIKTSKVKHNTTQQKGKTSHTKFRPPATLSIKVLPSSSFLSFPFISSHNYTFSHFLLFFTFLFLLLHLPTKAGTPAGPGQRARG